MFHVSLEFSLTLTQAQEDSQRYSFLFFYIEMQVEMKKDGKKEKRDFNPIAKIWWRVELCRCLLFSLFSLFTFFYAFDVDLLFKLNAQGLNAMEFILEKIRKIAGDSWKEASNWRFWLKRKKRRILKIQFMCWFQKKVLSFSKWNCNSFWLSRLTSQNNISQFSMPS